MNIFQGVSLEKTFYIQVTIFLGDIDAKKDQKNPPKTSHKIFSQCLIVTSSFLWAFMVENVCKNSFLGGKNRKNGIPVLKITFAYYLSPRITGFHELPPKQLSSAETSSLIPSYHFFHMGNYHYFPNFISFLWRETGCKLVSPGKFENGKLYSNAITQQNERGLVLFWIQKRTWW